MIAASGLLDELSFSSFVRHDHVHFIHISLEPSKGLAEITNKSCDFPNRTSDGLADLHCTSVGGEYHTIGVL